MTDHEGQESMAGTRRPIIEVKNLRKEYPVLDETVVALERINLTIPQGQICCIYGESGSAEPASRYGKTDQRRRAHRGSAHFSVE